MMLWASVSTTGYNYHYHYFIQNNSFFALSYSKELLQQIVLQYRKKNHSFQSCVENCFQIKVNITKEIYLFHVSKPVSFSSASDIMFLVFYTFIILFISFYS